jgi:hypothetical protein
VWNFKVSYLPSVAKLFSGTSIRQRVHEPNLKSDTLRFSQPCPCMMQEVGNVADKIYQET